MAYQWRPEYRTGTHSRRLNGCRGLGIPPWATAVAVRDARTGAEVAFEVEEPSPHKAEKRVTICGKADDAVLTYTLPPKPKPKPMAVSAGKAQAQG